MTGHVLSVYWMSMCLFIHYICRTWAIIAYPEARKGLWVSRLSVIALFPCIKGY